MNYMSVLVVLFQINFYRVSPCPLCAPCPFLPQPLAFFTLSSTVSLPARPRDTLRRRDELPAHAAEPCVGDEHVYLV